MPSFPIFRAALPATLALTLGACSMPMLQGAGGGTDGTRSATLQLARANEDAGNYTEAAKLFEQVLATDPNSVAALLGAGESYGSLGQTLRAEDALKRGLKLDPGNVDILNQLGRIRLAEHDSAGAIAYFNRALNESPRNVSAFTGKAVALDYASQHRAAQAVYKRALAIYPTNYILLSDYALSLVVTGQQERGIRILQDLIRDPTAAKHVRGNLALAYGLAGRDTDARATLKTDFSAAEIKHNIAVYHSLRRLMAEGKPIGALVFG
ncbi:tetratricopeptide repeat protein [Solirhodobacter olei]|uniref:tetratricopeptide repeat protein n=1 Tax=Solirhodobacter olei TaxID=2493082 RepID=UPI001F4E487F|nr:tetratricopeptide repeat protein [Solirhodobacter olei]